METFAVVASADSVTTARRKPMRRTMSVCAPAGTLLSVKFPSAAERASSVVPCTLTVALGTGFVEPSSVTRPVTRR